MAKRTYLHNGTTERETGAAERAPARTFTEDVYVRLRDDIIEGRLAPGEKLRIEHLKTRYGVGAGTLREAITQLTSDALVMSEGQRGFWVSPVSVDDLEDLTRLRMEIEIEALRQSIRSADPQWRERVQLAYQQLTAFEQPILPARLNQWEALNTQFHEALVSGKNSVWTHRVLRLLARQSERYRRLSFHLLPSAGRDVHAEHAMIFEASMAGAEARAALALEMHIRATPDLIARAYRDGESTDKALLLSRATDVASGNAPM